MIVGGGVVLAASYEAKAFGIRTAMGGRLARRLCPHAVVVPPRMSAYSEASKAVYRVFDHYSPLVEGLSIDEAFLDVRGLGHIHGTPSEIARQLKREVREQVGLPITVGVARRSSSPRSRARARSPTGCCSCRRAASSTSCTRCGSRRSGASAPVTARKLHAAGS